jgi:hypothetical protein
MAILPLPAALSTPPGKELLTNPTNIIGCFQTKQGKPNCFSLPCLIKKGNCQLRNDGFANYWVPSEKLLKNNLSEG